MHNICTDLMLIHHQILMERCNTFAKMHNVFTYLMLIHHQTLPLDSPLESGRGCEVGEAGKLIQAISTL